MEQLKNSSSDNNATKTERVASSSAQLGVDICGLEQKQEFDGEKHMLELVLNSFSELIAFYEPNHTIRWMNNAAKKFYGIPDDSYIGQYCYRVRFNADAPCVDCPMNSNNSEPHERTVYNNGLIWQVTHTPIFDSMGKISGYIDRSIDVTEKMKLKIENENVLRGLKEGEQRLKKSFQFIEGVINAIPEPIFIKDRQHRFVLSNDAHCKFRKMPLEDFISKSDFDHYPEPKAKLFWDEEEKIFETDNETQYDDFQIDNNGNPNYFVLRKVRFTGTDGEKYLAGTIHDITERKIAEAKLFQREQEFRTLVENSPDIIVRYDTNLNRIYFNPAFKKISNLRVSDLTGTSPAQLSPLPPRLILKYNETIKRAIETSMTQTMELQVQNSYVDLWFNMKAVPEFDKDGNLTSVLAISRDVTELRRTKQMTEMLSFAINNASDAVFISKEKSPNFSYVNDQACCSLGYSREELLGMTVFDINPDATLEILKQIDTNIASGKLAIFETLHKTKDGRIFPVEIKNSRFRYNDTTHVMNVVHDISERKRAEKVLQEERKLFIGGPNVAFVWKAVDGWPVEYVSPNIIEQFGYAPEDFISGKVSFVSIVHPDDLLRIADEVTRYSELSTPYFEQEYRIAHANGEYRWVYDFTVPVRNEKDEITHYKGYLTDITGRKQAEQALEDSQRRLAKAEIVASLGHTEYDFKKGIYHWSEGAYEILNVPKVLRRPGHEGFRDLIHPDDFDRVNKAINNAIRKQTKFDEMYRVIDFNGKEKVIHGFGEVESSKNGTLGNFFSIIQDITLTYNMNAQLVAEEKKFRILAECAPVGIYLSIGETPVYANKTMFDIIGVGSMEAFAKINLTDVVIPEDRPKISLLEEKLSNKDEDSKPFKLTLRKFAVDSTVRLFDVHVTVFTINSTRYMQFIVSDITEDYENEQIRQQLAASSLYIEQKNQFASEIESVLKEIISTNPKYVPSDFKPALEILKSFSYSDKDWELLNAHLANIHPEFVANLKKRCPTLSVNDIKHCACMRLNLDTKEIARLFNVKPESIQTSRSRLKKKLGLPESSDLRAFILAL